MVMMTMIMTSSYGYDGGTNADEDARGETTTTAVKVGWLPGRRRHVSHPGPRV